MPRSVEIRSDGRDVRTYLSVGCAAVIDKSNRTCQKRIVGAHAVLPLDYAELSNVFRRACTGSDAADAEDECSGGYLRRCHDRAFRLF